MTLPFPLYKLATLKKAISDSQAQGKVHQGLSMLHRALVENHEDNKKEL